MIAERIGVDSTAISKIESGARSLSFAEAISWIEACGGRLEYLSAQEVEVLSAIRAAPGQRAPLLVRVVELAGSASDLVWALLAAQVETLERASNVKKM